MTKQEREELRRLEAKATPDHWNGDDRDIFGMDGSFLVCHMEADDYQSRVRHLLRVARCRGEAVKSAEELAHGLVEHCANADPHHVSPVEFSDACEYCIRDAIRQAQLAAFREGQENMRERVAMAWQIQGLKGAALADAIRALPIEEP